MGHRLSKIYTRTGDDGSTGLADGSRVSKDDVRMVLLGDLDELSASLGLLRCELTTGSALEAQLQQVQQQLLNMGGDIAMPGMNLLPESLPAEMELQMDQMNDVLGPLKEFILPGGNRAAATCHLARAITRRAERHLVQLHRQHPQPERLLRFLNRLSDWLFVVARYLAHSAGSPEILWDRRSSQQ